MLSSHAAFISAFAITDEQELFLEADEQNLETPQVTRGGRRQSEYCSHTHTSQCVTKQKNTLILLVCSSR